MLNIDFLPERILQQRARRRRVIRQSYLLVACVAAMALLAYVRQGMVAQALAERDMIGERAASTLRQLETRDRLQREEAELLLKQRIDDQLGTRVSGRDVLAELSRLVPASTSLVKLDIEAAEVPVTVESASPGQRSGRARSGSGRSAQKYRMVKRVRLAITGLAPNDVDVANFIGQLSACPLFEEVHMGYAKTVAFRGQEAREFNAKCYVVR